MSACPLKVYRPLVEFGQPSDAGSVPGPGQVVAGQQRIEVRIGLQRPRCSSPDWSAPDSVFGTPVRIQTHRVERRIDDPEAVFFRQDRVLPRDSQP